MQSKLSGWLVALALGVVASQGEQGCAQCDGPVVVQVPKQAASIAEAVAMACPGHPLEIVLAEGIWPMAIDTQDPSIEITIRGVSKTGSVVTETEAGVPLNARYGSSITFTSVTVQDVSLSDQYGYQWDIRFNNCLVDKCVGSFTSGGAVGSRFTNCSGGYYGLIDIAAGSVVACEFVGCANAIAVWCDGVVIRDCIFNDYESHAILLKAQASIRNCTFTGGNGSALNTDGGSGNCGLGDPTQPYILENCTFTNCASGVPGGAISDRTDANTPRVWEITNCTFTNNSASSGGAMYFGIDRSVTLTDCVFEGNSATAGDGGAFSHEFGGSANHLTASGCSFAGNEATERGGAIMTVGWSGTYSLNDCTFTGNHASFGGAFHNDRGLVSAMNCEFHENSAAVTGGAMTLEAGSRGMFSACEFSMNHAAEGGAIGFYFWADTTIAECMFSGNSASLRGGAVQIRLQTAPTISGCEFVGNSAPIGAAVARLDNSAGNPDFPRLMNCVFRGHDDETSDAVVSSVEWTTTVVGSSFCDNAIAAAVGDVDFDASNCVVEFCTDANGDGEVDACACPGDLNGNFFTDGADLSILLGYWGPVTNPNNPADLNDDGLVDGADLAVMLGGWGTCP